MKQEPIEITYSYWDGSGHRKVVQVRSAPLPVRITDCVGSPSVLGRQCKKGDTIAQFLEKCRQQFPELRMVSVDSLMYIKEDLIIPHVSFSAVSLFPACVLTGPSVSCPSITHSVQSIESPRTFGFQLTDLFSASNR